MALLSEIAIAGLILLAFVPVLFLAVECALACLRRTDANADAERSAGMRLAVLIPAHNEEACLAETLANVLPGLNGDDRVVVVADNCDDGTAGIARRLGAEVVERTDQERRGKGYALDAGIRYLAADPPDVLVMLDADCVCAGNAVATLAEEAHRTGRPQQAVYLMETPKEPSAGARVSAFAFRMKNLVRPLGLRCAGMPCLLTGTGMAFPWDIIRSVPLASGNIVEDMQLGLDLALAGHLPLLCPGARVEGLLPQQASAADTQRTRWEHGHLQTMLTQAPRLILHGIARRSLSLIALGLEVAVPPLSLLVLMWVLVAAMALSGYLAAGWVVPLVLAIAGWLLLAVSIGLAWWKFGRDLLPARMLIFIPVYILRKIPRFIAFAFHRQRDWVRTARDA